MNLRPTLIYFAFIFALSEWLWGYTPPSIPYSPAAGVPGSSAILYDSQLIAGWATAIFSISFGSEVSEEFRTLSGALGPARGVSPDVLVLGRGGSVVLEFQSGIADREGWDFAVFENAFRETFLELAYVEVSTDGIHFVRFPNYSLTPEPISSFGDVQPSFIHGLAGKYLAGNGTPFDLGILEDAYEAALSGKGGFSQAFSEQLIGNFPNLDLQEVNYVRLIDVIGDGTSLDCEGDPIYDPYPTVISAGFDLDAVGVLNPAEPDIITFEAWAQAFGISPIPDADMDGDKWNNYLEYLLGSDPLQRSSIPDHSTSISPDGTIILQFWRNLSSESIPLVESSINGAAWTRITSNNDFVSDLKKLDDGTLMGRIEIRFADPPESLFWRIVSTQ